ncbi:hypothetical protein [Agrococcus sp. KRD186]|uniref:hypothetical protein n=1 Tax=Agrococcus sp. KRD186 TaxID=2729730 RepID=UPI0019D2C330|nr:hypothetical protein [Agrococcus sp. KRD186]
MPTRRARLGIGHALAWVAFGLAAAALVTDALGRDRAPLALALGAACALAAAALGIDMLGIGLRAIGAGDDSARRSRGRDASVLAPDAPRTLQIVAALVATAALAVAGALALLDQPPHLAVCGALGFAAGAHIAAMRARVAAHPALAPRVRPAPTLLAAAAGVALAALVPALGAAAGLGPVPASATGIALIAAAVLQLIVMALAAAATPAVDRADGPVADRGTHSGGRGSEDGPVADRGTRSEGSSNLERVRGAQAAPHAPQAAPHGWPPTRTAQPARVSPALLALLAIAAAGLAALAALRPALSAIGADHPQPAGPIALTLALGALLGPPLAMLAERSGGRTAAILATVGGAAALVAPIARPGVLDWVAAALLGVALAASVALAELARRADQRLATGATALLLLAGAAGAGLAALLLQAVPLPDVVLGAALACLVAGVGVWAPHSASMADAGDGRQRRRRGDDPEGSSL